MNTYPQIKSGSNVMPFIMGCTKPSQIEALEENEKVFYDPERQTAMINLRVVGTRSLKTFHTKIKQGLGKTDKKNEIDDSKSVR